MGVTETLQIAEEVDGISYKFGVGGDFKMNSSSWILKSIQKQNRND